MKILAISPHTDDIELAAGATLSKCVRLGCDVHVCIMCDLLAPQLREELSKSMSMLGITSYEIGNLPNRYMPDNRQYVYDVLESVDNEKGPFDVVITPHPLSLHQDHAAVGMEAVRVFRSTTLIAFIQPWNMASWVKGDCTVEVSSDDLDHKLQALRCYKSQSHKYYMAEQYIRSMARVMGATLGDGKYAEDFEVLRLVVRGWNVR